jgi:hypothetical protein
MFPSKPDLLANETHVLKLIHIFWSLAILAAIIFIPVLLHPTNSNLHGGPDLYAFFLLIWAIVSMTTPVLIILHNYKIIRKELYFTFTLLFVLNLYFGIIALFKIFIDETLKSLHLAYILFPLNLLWSVLIVIDLVVRYRRHRAT